VIRGLIVFWREGGNDLLKARIAAKRVPERQKFQLTIADRAWRADGNGQLFAGEILVPSPGSYHGQILNHQRTIDGIFFHGKKRDRAPSDASAGISAPHFGQTLSALIIVGESLARPLFTA
jgi:hypothetical protein